MKVGRNAPCPCGSGRKYKQCCLQAAQRTPLKQRLLWALAGALLVLGAIGMAVAIGERSSGGAKRVWSEEHQHWHEVP